MPEVIAQEIEWLKAMEGVLLRGANKHVHKIVKKRKKALKKNIEFYNTALGDNSEDHH